MQKSEAGNIEPLQKRGAGSIESMQKGGTEVAPEESPANIGVPAECEDVMLQCFYWDSYKLTKYGKTRWTDLLEDTTAIRENFDLVWFPPSGYAGGDANDGFAAGGVGYYHRQVSQQNSAWGTRINLDKLIKALHRGDTKCLADIVINHRNNKSNWCDFFDDSFGLAGRFQFTEKHICRGDECFTKSESTCYGSTDKGAADTGTNDAGCRDLDHSNEYVQEWAKTYVKWMIEKVGYDGFRYDMTRGYDGKYLSMYNEAANPYLSVSEFWMDNVNDQIAHLKDANYNTMIFDFPLKGAIGNAFKNGTYSQLKNPSNSLRGKGLGKYAVTFIDNHDTFERSDNQGGEFIKYNADLGNADVKSKILQANAYILMMPGVPCVFWPHWKSYTEEINRLIAIRKLAGIHSESVVTDEESAGYKYGATIQGHHRRVYLRLGKNRDMTQPANTYVAASGSEYTIYVETGEGIEDVQRDHVQGTKVLKDGQLYLMYKGTMYDVQGRRIDD
ncbi:MAG: hypothetical protein IJ249_03875 [Paludibacteraceae bacterium]|nr:hypothetical protein [Paludibacteraceae bacterium]